MMGLSKASREVSWRVWACIKPSEAKELDRQHSGMGDSTGVPLNELDAQEIKLHVETNVDGAVMVAAQM